MQIPPGTAPLRVEGLDEPVGTIGPGVAACLDGLARTTGDGWLLPSPGHDLQSALDASVERLIAAGLCDAPRGEAIDVRATRDGTALAQVDRAAAAPLGLLVRKVCLVARIAGDRPGVWLARRGPNQRTAPGLLDTTVAGGVKAGASDADTLAEEAFEEASLTRDVLAAARFAARLDRVAPMAEGLEREDLLVWDLDLPADVMPRPRDEEIAGFLVMPLPDLADALVAPRAFKPGAAIVLRNALARWGV
ncbi:NUDIX domain-containing protein [Salinarimonas ramus]|uniref:Nudix hydrolase domain-containing protein n=1 Tax=Salinarimonas ramus TaxID=690164 RepID=A0A917V236_9HYPH|nr:NUDIX domain-containing protein [Salinarimonas ramus]GGK19346.1 hypothetical protein GCM10011322_02550 [Salinarimonas ramus]